MSLHVILHRVADLSDPEQQKILLTNSQELTGMWANSSADAPTQKLGAALFAVPKLEGLIYPSSKLGSRNLVVFMDKLDPRSSITFKNELNRTRESIL